MPFAVGIRGAAVISLVSKGQLPLTGDVLCADHLTASNAAFNVAIRSSTFSIPIESRIVFGLMPCSSSSSSVLWLCVVVAGWITSDFTSATFASREKMARLSINVWAVFASPLISKVKIEPPPLGRYFLYNAWLGSLSRDG